MVQYSVNTTVWSPAMQRGGGKSDRSSAPLPPWSSVCTVQVFPQGFVPLSPIIVVCLAPSLPTEQSFLHFIFNIYMRLSRQEISLWSPPRRITSSHGVAEAGIRMYVYLSSLSLARPYSTLAKKCFHLGEYAFWDCKYSERVIGREGDRTPSRHVYLYSTLQYSFAQQSASGDRSSVPKLKS